MPEHGERKEVDIHDKRPELVFKNQLVSLIALSKEWI